VKELKSPDKIVQQMTRDGAVEINKTTSNTKRIRTPEQQATKKKLTRKANKKIYDKAQKTPETSRLKFTNTEWETPPNGKLQHIFTRPGREAVSLIRSEVRKNEDDNTGVQALGFSKRTAESATHKISDVHNRLKFEPKNKNAGTSKKALQKSKIKRDYAKAFRQGDFEGVKKSAKKAKEAVKKAEDRLRETAKFTRKHWKGITVLGILAVLGTFIFVGCSSCTEMFSGAFTAIIGTSYTAAEDDILGTEADYTILENALAVRIDNIPNTYPGYDEYNYYLDEIGHDPFELASYLTAKHNAYTRTGVQSELAAIISQQYTLTLTTVTEIRYRTELRTGTYAYTDPETGEVYEVEYTYEVQVPYYYYILNVTLINNGIDSVAQTNLTPEQYEMYLVYMETKGNRPDLFP